MTAMVEAVQRRWLALPGIVLVAIGAGLWGTDALFRRGLALSLPSTTVVFWEHLILVAVTFPLLLAFFRSRPQLNGRDIVSLLLIGVGASALATMLFTEAFSYGNPTTPLLLQKLQPVVAILGAYVLLKERLLPRFGVYFVVAIGSAWLISFGDPGNVSVDELAPALLAIGAAALWGMGTVLGRHLTAKIVPNQLTALRFAIGLPASAVIVAFRGETSIATGIDFGDFGTLVALSLITGLVAIAIYYRGLQTTPASAATLAELTFPLTAILIGWARFDTVPTDTQWLGIAVLAATIVVMSRAASRTPEAIGVVASADRSASAVPERAA